MSRSKQLYLFNQVYPYIPFHVEFKAKPNNLIFKIVWRNNDKNGAFLVLNIFFMTLLKENTRNKQQNQ
jgi:hypothetical protein